MIVIPMLGRSSRFFDSGYLLPKYQLPIGSETLFERSVRSFEKLFFNTHFLFLVRSDFGAKEFVANKLIKLGIKDYRVIELKRGFSYVIIQFFELHDFKKYCEDYMSF